MIALGILAALSFLFLRSDIGKIFMSVFFIVLVYEVMFGDPPPPKPTPSERRVARQVERNEELTKPSILIPVLERAIAERNKSEIDRLYKSMIWDINGHNDRGKPHLVARDAGSMRRIIETCPVELLSTRDKDWGMSQIRVFLRRAQGIAETQRATGFLP